MSGTVLDATGRMRPADKIPDFAVFTLVRGKGMKKNLNKQKKMNGVISDSGSCYDKEKAGVT